MVITEGFPIRFGVPMPKRQHPDAYVAMSGVFLSSTSDRVNPCYGQQTTTLTELLRAKTPNLKVRSNGS